MTESTSGTYRGREIRVTKSAGRYWFVAQDICEALGIQNPSMVVRTQVDPGDVTKATFETPGGPQQFLAVSDLGLYQIILASRGEDARAFEAWVSGTFFPSLGLKAPDQE